MSPLIVKRIFWRVLSCERHDGVSGTRNTACE